MVIICLMGKSCSGKSRLELEIEKHGYNRSISYTTRKPREGEKHKREYYFVNEEKFKKLIKKGFLMEWSTYNGNYYGSPKPVGTLNNVVVLETEGYKKIRELYGKQVIGVYVDIDSELSKERALERLKIAKGADLDNIKMREEEDTKKFNGIENLVDIIVNGNDNIENSVNTILNFINNR